MKSPDRPTILVITGPTASGKTGLSLQLAQKLNGAIISADSRMVYQGLNIGTGKPTWEYQTFPHAPWMEPMRISAAGPVYAIADIDHYLLNICTPNTLFTLADWLTTAHRAIQEILAQGKLPIIVGGTGLYLKALTEGFILPPTDTQLRKQLEQLSDEDLHAAIAAVDPVTAVRERANRRRLIRAVEVYRLTGRSIHNQATDIRYTAKIIGLDWPRAVLYQRIDERIRTRLDAGMLDEVRSLIASGVDQAWLQSIGLEYRVITDWLEAGAFDEEKLATDLRGTIHSYARRQLTYLKRQLPVVWGSAEYFMELSPKI